METLGDSIVVTTLNRAERKLDGTVWLVQRYRKCDDRVVIASVMVMRTHDGNLISNRQRWNGGPTDVIEVRKARRGYLKFVPDGMDWSGPDVLRNPDPEYRDLTGATFSHILRVYPEGTVLLSYVQGATEVVVMGKRLSDGRWLIAPKDAMTDAHRNAEAEIISDGIYTKDEDFEGFSM
ncbi:hypothetical protein GCM10011335_13590 [Aureimonas glaciei]|uniref:Uncharacterized protein n=1 Tax=Aureimonas glaciei TaxID=1776957 RepID=A0A916XUJ6_9HYPH|nr:hypothetical protein GCM10011335_13590 [Aureimonas glaciei]